MYQCPMQIKIGNFSVELIKHSIGRENRKEAITYLFTYERFIHAEVMTHRWSRNYSSSRAIPYDKMQEWIAKDPALPLHLGSNRPGMQSGAEVEDREGLKRGLINTLHHVNRQCDYIIETYNPHKEIINRYTEPWGWITGIATMGRDQLMNFFHLRICTKAHPNIQRLAVSMARLYRDSQPQVLDVGQWHIPFSESVAKPGYEVNENLIWSVARAAWCSYNNPTKDATFDKAKKRHDDCIVYKHATPLEHQLRCRVDDGQSGCVPGYDSYRSMIPDEMAREFDFGILDRDYKDRDFVPDV